MFEIVPGGPFDLAASIDFAGGFAPGLGGHAAAADSTERLLMAFPLEDWTGSAAVELWQDMDGVVRGDVLGTEYVQRAIDQAARCLSLDHDGNGWPLVGERDPVVGRLQSEYRMIRPVCFYSAWEAATSFVIGQRISMSQGAKVKRWLADEVGDRVELGGGRTVNAFPRPQQLVEHGPVPGISDEKVRRLGGLARAALDGKLDTGLLRALPEDEALARLRELPGVGPWTAEGILMRGCGTADTLPLGDAVSRGAVQALYGLPALPTDPEWLGIAEVWHPYRMWATVLLHMAWRREQVATPSYRQAQRTTREEG